LELATGTTPSQQPNSYNCHPDFQITYTYASGAQVICTSQGTNGVRFEGENGDWIFVSRGGIQASSPQLLSQPLSPEAVRLYVSTDHMGNFLDCVRSRRRPVCDVEIGYRTVTVCHIGVIALRLGKKLLWDPVRELFDDPEANAMLSRPMRSPWKLEV
jgi:hypothetical protein